MRWFRRGLIPAHAGKTTAKTPSWRSGRAHPRSRGENSRMRSKTWPFAGSSPLTRGKRLASSARASWARLIPAHAGKTGGCARRSPGWPAHPRSRGENLLDVWGDAEALGSSPLTRGKPLDRALSGKWQGLIPAHAGKTRSAEVRPGDHGAHPRSRGENVVFPLLCVAALGSSPLTRGKPCPPRRASAWTGLIPAHAGKTRSRRRWRS